MLEAIEYGDMPPKDKAQPAPVAAADFNILVVGILRETAGPPPIALRRIFRREFEHTMHDQLGIDTPLADMLPEDGRAQGFDNVGRALGISPV